MQAQMAALVEFGAMAEASETRTVSESVSDKQILLALKLGNPCLLSRAKKGKSGSKMTKLQSPTANSTISLSLIRSCGEKRKFFMHDKKVSQYLSSKAKRAIEKAKKIDKPF